MSIKLTYLIVVFILLNFTYSHILKHDPRLKHKLGAISESYEFCDFFKFMQV